MRKIAVLTYATKHRKTYDTLCLLKAKGYGSVTVYAQPMLYKKKRQPLVQHRPELIMSIPENRDLCNNLGFRYCEGTFEELIAADDDSIFLLCGAGLLPESFIALHKIVNSHPGYIPYARGLDSYKWSIYNKQPIGVTTHLLGAYIDGGEIIEQRKITVETYDTFHSVAQRVYENEIDMLIGAIEKIDDEHKFIVPMDKIFRRMPADIEKELFNKFEAYKNSLSDIQDR